MAPRAPTKLTFKMQEEASLEAMFETKEKPCLSHFFSECIYIYADCPRFDFMDQLFACTCGTDSHTFENIRFCTDSHTFDKIKICTDSHNAITSRFALTLTHSIISRLY